MIVLTTKRSALAFAFGILLILLAGAYSYIEQGFDALSILFFVVAGILILLSLAAKSTSEHKEFASFQWQRLGVFIILAITLVGFLIAVHLLAERIPYRWDVTQFKQHTLSQATLDFVEDIELADNSSIQMTALYVGLPPRYLQDLLNEYERISNGKISVTIVDPIDDIASAAEFGDVISGQERKLSLIHI